MPPTILLAETSFDEEARAILERCGRVLDYGSAEEFERRLPEAEAIVVGLEVRLDRDVLERAPRLRVIASRTSQLLHVDTDEAARRGIDILHHEPDAPAIAATSSTAEATMALIFALARNLPWAFDELRTGRWERARFVGRELQDMTIGLIGFGRIGRRVAGYSRAFGMRVLAYDPGVGRESIVAGGAEALPLPELLRESDVVSLHCAYSREEGAWFGAEHFRLMKPTALFVNTARGEITDETALLAALSEGHLAGAALDVLTGEMPDGDHLVGNPLVEYARLHENLLIVPHLGGATYEATARTQRHIARRLADYLA